ncbi:hypothetical protein [Vreelandella aquamarina]|uniref:hypothetical protein n=1 Tax=Vreelandella aquamarina TaxID=77097 RepID=UPI00384EE837
MAIEFNKDFYLQSKFNQLEKAGRLEEFGLTDVASLAAFFEENGVDAQEHYLNFGMAEGINPSADFDTTAYLEAKLAELKDTAKYGDTYAEYTIADVIAAFKKANLTPLQHFNTYGESEGLTAAPAEEEGEVSELTEALEGLLTAQANKVSFLEDEAADVEAVADKLGNDPTPEQIETAVGAVLDDTILAVNNLTDAAIGDISKTRSDAYNQAIIDEQQAELADDVTDAQTAVNKVEGLDAAVDAVQAAEASIKAAVDAQLVTKAAVAGAVAEFDAIDGQTVDATYAAGTSGVLVTDANAASAAVISVVNGKLEVAAGYKEAKGITALLTAVQADFTALQAIDTANANEDDAWLAAAELEGYDEDANVATSEKTAVTTFDGLVNTYNAKLAAYTAAPSDSTAQTELVSAYGALNTNDSTAFPSITDQSNPTNNAADEIAAADSTTQSSIATKEIALDAAVDAAVVTAFEVDATTLTAKLIAAEKAAADFDKAVNEYLAAKATADELKGYNDAIETAIEDIEALDYVVDDNNSGSADNDVFVFAGEDATISGFGAQGDDVLYIGDGFTKVDLEASADITASSQGDAATLEVFFQQDGNDTVIYLEGEAFEGNAKTAFEGNTITLTGVDAASLQYENGAVSIVEVA